ncbi:hypothetical protein [Thomasclavelia spiroformis]|uniref:hypothetical protein n=1 Tax=Thomasclavelia spiroformis TaxID=29348 RepID=UPI00242A83D1|nr:hypothetical protein [Thomasclavelia spiroformis]
MESKKADTRDVLEILNDIKERNDIIDTYRFSGYLDRDDAIHKILELRITDNQVREITTIKLSLHATSFVEASDEQIINELMMQVNILKSKLLSK